jgi:predicted DNA-binding protein (MmcQ/YjbR family)
MKLDAFDALCRSLPAVTYVNQWGGSHVYKVGGKIFAIAAAFGSQDGHAYTFKVSEMSYELLIEQGLARPAPYLARAKWVQLVDDEAMSHADLTAYITQAHAIIAAKLTRATRNALGLTDPPRV